MISTIIARKNVKNLHCFVDGSLDQQGILQALDWKVPVLCRVSLTRMEHPHCAFTHKAGEKDGIAGKISTLYVPDGKLTMQTEETNGQIRIILPYVRKKEHLDKLLVYLKDIHVELDVREYRQAVQRVNDHGWIAAQTGMTPWMQLIHQWMADEVFPAEMEEDAALRECLRQMKRIFRDQCQIFCALPADVRPDLIILPDDLDGHMQPPMFDRFCVQLYRELKAASSIPIMMTARDSLHALWPQLATLSGFGLALPWAGEDGLREMRKAMPGVDLMPDLSSAPETAQAVLKGSEDATIYRWDARIPLPEWMNRE